MGGKKKPGKKVVSQKNREQRILELKSFVKKIEKFDPSERYEYFKTIPKEEVDLISEICVNLLNGNLKPTTYQFSLLQRVKNYVRGLANRKKSLSNKRALLVTIYGLNAVNLLISLTSHIL